MKQASFISRREAACKLSTPHHPIRDKRSDEVLGGFRSRAKADIV
jgi:hypothetical protein